MQQRQAVIVTGGAPPSPAVLAVLPERALVLAADSGYDHALAIGLRVDVLVGDFDSISSAGLDHAKSSGVELEWHPADKDFTDTELAIKIALRRRCSHLVCVAGGELDRLDHFLGLLGVFATHPSTLWIGRSRTDVLIGPTKVHLDAALEQSTVSLLPWNGDASGVSTRGLRWPLHDATLSAGSSRGVSNEVVDPTKAAVAIESGTLLVIQPEVLP